MRERVLLTPFTQNILHPQFSDTTLVKLEEQSENIEYTAKTFDIDPIKLKAIICVERTNNYSRQDEYFDDYPAKKGQNSSIGFCRVKMKTAYWIEYHLTDSTSEFYPGRKYKDILSISQSPQEIIDKLKDNRTNFLYASAYMRIIQSYWKSREYSIEDRVDTIATIFSYGMFSRQTGELLKFNANPQPNWFGLEIEDILQKIEMIDI